MELNKKERIKALKILLREIITRELRAKRGKYPGLCAAVWVLNDGIEINYDAFSYLNKVIQANRPKRMRWIDRLRKSNLKKDFFWDCGYFWPMGKISPRVKFLIRLIIKEMIYGR